MSTVATGPVMLYTEQTPNPETIKFVVNRMLYKGTADFRTRDLADEWSPLAAALFDHAYVKGVYICNNFVSITKEFNYNWPDIMLVLKEFIKQYIADDKPILKKGFDEAMEAIETEKSGVEYTGDDAELVKKIKELIDTYVKPAVEIDRKSVV